MTSRMRGGALTRRGRVWCATSLSAAAFAVAASLGAGTAVHADEPPAADGDTVVVAVGLPPVPPVAVEVVVVEVGLPPVPPASDILGGDATSEVGEAPVPTVPDTGGDESTGGGPGPSVDSASVTSSIAGAVAATASAAWHDE